MQVAHPFAYRLAAVAAALVLMGPAHAQLTSPAADPWARTSAGPDRLGLHSLTTQMPIGCGASSRPSSSAARAQHRSCSKTWMPFPM